MVDYIKNKLQIIKELTNITTQHKIMKKQKPITKKTALSELFYKKILK